MSPAKLSSNQKTIFSAICKKLQIPEKWLYILIHHESKWNPTVANPRSSAKGLIQFINSTAQILGYKNSQNLIEENPTIESQLILVYKYLSRFKPFNSIQSLFMSVFYPPARSGGIFKKFPEKVIRSNPGIKTPADYIARAFLHAGYTYTPPVLYIFLGGTILYLLLKKKKGGIYEKIGKAKRSGPR